MSGGMNQRNYKNSCLTMHQPWASLLVYGIKRIEGRSWPAPIRGRLWIHAASKVPDEATIQAMEDFYREIYAVNGISDIKFPEHYPVSRLLGCVEVVGCVRGEELAQWEALPAGVRLEALTDFCWLCEKPQKLVIPFEMRGYQGVYNLEKKIYEAAVRGITPVEGPFPVKFPLPNPGNPFSLSPGSIARQFPESKTCEVEKSSGLNAVIAGARAASMQFAKKGQNLQITTLQNGEPKGKFFDDDRELPSNKNKVSKSAHNYITRGQRNKKSVEEDTTASSKSMGDSNYRTLRSNNKEQSNSSSSCQRAASANSDQHPGATKIFAAALKGLNSS